MLLQFDNEAKGKWLVYDMLYIGRVWMTNDLSVRVSFISIFIPIQLLIWESMGRHKNNGW